tara:strand:+ start:774 stop:1730 length:957 start_codon:yes stop_codon:yes gene_type:complete
MSVNQEDEELRNLKREVAKLKLEANLRKSLADQLAAQKKIADEAKVEVEKKSKEVEAISTKLSKYLSPQIHEQIFSGKQDAEVKSNRKKLTMFFSDIVGFTSISDELESEEITNLLNFYLNEMSDIALEYGGTIDKYIGDGLMIFFGDPDTLGVEEDAKKCVEMAVSMQKKMNELTGYWGKTFGLKKELQVRMGINTGFCTVGNFGSNDRLDYTAVGSAVNLASRLESAATPGAIMVSEETYLLVKQYFSFKDPKEIEIKGLLRKVKLYELEIETSVQDKIIRIHRSNFDISINRKSITQEDLSEIKALLSELEVSLT